MCGIVGIININGPQANGKSLAAMAVSIYRRGPDDEGYMLFHKETSVYHGDASIRKDGKHIRASYDEKYELGFGFRQLKIIDLSYKSHQPMSDASGKYWLIFNGEIYNYKEIKTDLMRTGVAFSSDSDTEVVLQSYIKWGEKALDKFNGMFAFSILDRVKNKVFIARDRMGIKPLYYHHSRTNFVFGSTIKSIVDSGLYTPEINWDGLAQNFRFSIAQRPHTSFKNIVALSPGHYLEFSLTTKNVKKSKYWDIPFGTQQSKMSEDEACELLEKSLIESVKLRLQADVDVGTFMSGGIDSTLISSIAVNHHPSLKAFTLGFEDFDEYNEVQQAIDTAKLYDFNHIVHYAKASSILEKIENAVEAYEEPYHHLPANLLIAEMAKINGAKVVLSGLGGDELFAGYDVYNRLALWRKLQKASPLTSLVPSLHSKIDKAKQLSSCQTVGEFYTHSYSTFNDSELNKLFGRSVIDNNKLLTEMYVGSESVFTDDLEAMSFYNLKSYIGNHHLRTIDQFTMHESIEGRVPFLDHNVIETAFKIPSKYKLKNKVQKHILRKLAKKYIAPSCLAMDKKGLRLPLEHWISNELNGIVKDHISALKNRKLLNASEIDRIIKQKNELKIWQLVSTEMWMQKFID